MYRKKPTKFGAAAETASLPLAVVDKEKAHPGGRAFLDPATGLAPARVTATYLPAVAAAAGAALVPAGAGAGAVPDAAGAVPVSGAGG